MLGMQKAGNTYEWAGCCPSVSICPQDKEICMVVESPQRCLGGQELHLEYLICTSAIGLLHRTKALVLAKAMHISYRCYSEITSDMFSGYFRKYNSVFTHSPLFKVYVFQQL